MEVLSRLFLVDVLSRPFIVDVPAIVTIALGTVFRSSVMWIIGTIPIIDESLPIIDAVEVVVLVAVALARAAAAAAAAGNASRD